MVPPVFGAQSLALFPSGKADVIVLKQLPLTGNWCPRQTPFEGRGWLDIRVLTPGTSCLFGDTDPSAGARDINNAIAEKIGRVIWCHSIRGAADPRVNTLTGQHVPKAGSLNESTLKAGC